MITAKDKRALQKLFRKDKKPQLFVYKTFAILIFLLIKDNLHQIDHIIIDTEYQGWGYLIKDFLLREIRNIRTFNKDDIIFKRIGRHDSAHKRALGVYRNGIKPDKVITTEDIERFI